MKKSILKYSLSISLLFSIVCNLYATPSDSTKQRNIIYQFELHQEINPSAARITLNAVKEAEELNASYILLDLNTYGGYVSDADIIRTALLDTEIPTIVFIRNNAASAGALISIACDSIYMKEGSTIGAAAVVNELGEIMPEKYQSYMRQKMRSTAESTNRNPDIAEGMVDPRVEIDSTTTNDKIITFSVNEAIKNGYCNAQTNTIEELIAITKLDNYQIEKHTPSTNEKIIAFLINPIIVGVLLFFIVGGIFFEVQSPGFGLPIIIATVAALLFFLPHYLEGLATSWEIYLFIAGIVLLALEIFVIPGFGVAGFLGLFAVKTGLILSLVRNIDGFDFSQVSKEQLSIAFLTIGIVAVTGVIGFFFGGQKIMELAFSKSKIENKTALTKEDNYIISESNRLKHLIGEIGTTATDLKLSGKIEIENEWYEAISNFGFIKKGESIKVLKIDGSVLVVEKV